MENFPNKEKLDGHKENCHANKQGHSLTVNDLLTLDLNQTQIPVSVEKATLRVLQYKINNSNDGTAEFASGGPRI